MTARLKFINYLFLLLVVKISYEKKCVKNMAYLPFILSGHTMD